MGIFGSGSGPLGRPGEAQRTYKVSAEDAAAMAAQWYAMAGVPADPQGIAWWTKQIQGDGSNTAFGNFSKGIAKDHGPAATQRLTTNAATARQSTGRDPWTPAQGAVNNQLPGTNYRRQASDATRGLGLKAGTALLTAGLTLPTRGPSGNPQTSGGVADASNPAGGDYGDIGDYGGANAGGGAFGLGTAAIDAIKKAAGGGATPGLPTPGAMGGGGGDIPMWLKALAAAQGVNVANLGRQSTEAAKEAVKYTTGEWDRRAPLRAQGVAGMDAGVAPVRLPGLAAISRSGNPFARVG